MTANNHSLLIHNALIVNSGRMSNGYVALKGDIISEVGEGAAPQSLLADAARVIDAAGRVLMPGVIDTHVHFRDPGLTHKGDMATESAAAVEGGVTSFIDMPNCKPMTITVDAVESKMARAAEVSKCNYAFFIGATNDNLEQLQKADYTRVAGVKLFLGSSTGNMLVDKAEMLDRLFSGVNALIAVHAESEAVVAANRSEALERFGQGNVPLEMHSQIRSRQACVDAAALAADMALKHRHPLHLLHISTADELDLLTPAHRRFVTTETAPHYLWFTSGDYARLGTRVKCNPAIKTDADRRRLTEALTDGSIDTIATDHAPHLPAEKQGDALTAASGMPGIKFSLPIMLEIARRNSIPLHVIAEKMAHAPARIFAIEKRGFIKPGYFADLVLVNTNARPHTVTDADASGRCGWTPYAGTTLHSTIDLTLVNGTVAFDGHTVSPDHAGRPLRFAPRPVN